jgi:hypothetical protein
MRDVGVKFKPDHGMAVATAPVRSTALAAGKAA